MSIFDISLLVIIGGFVINGLFKGLIKILGNVVGLIIGAFVASHYYLAFYSWALNWTWLRNVIGVHQNIGRVAAFILVFVITTRLVGVIFYLIEKFFDFIAVIPGSKYINNLLGGALGFLEGALFLGLIIYVASRYTLVGNFFGQQLTDSTVAPLLLKVVNIILPVLPEALKALKSVI